MCFSQLNGDYFINHEIRIPNKQPGFQWRKYPPAGFFLFRDSHVGVDVGVKNGGEPFVGDLDRWT